MSPRDGADDGPKTKLSSERVLAGAVALADQIGMDGFTIRKLASELDTKPMTIYHHVPNKEAIIDGMVDLPRTRERMPDTPQEAFVSPEGFADAVSFLLHQRRGAWTFELDIRPHVENW